MPLPLSITIGTLWRVVSAIAGVLGGGECVGGVGGVGGGAVRWWLDGAVPPQA